jgi:hypothetical protein
MADTGSGGRRAPARLCASTGFPILLAVTERRPLLSADQIPKFKVMILLLDPLDEKARYAKKTECSVVVF